MSVFLFLCVCECVCPPSPQVSVASSSQISKNKPKCQDKELASLHHSVTHTETRTHLLFALSSEEGGRVERGKKKTGNNIAGRCCHFVSCCPWLSFILLRVFMEAEAHFYPSVFLFVRRASDSFCSERQLQVPGRFWKESVIFLHFPRCLRTFTRQNHAAFRVGIILFFKWRGFSSWATGMSFLMFHSATERDKAIQLTRKWCAFNPVPVLSSVGSLQQEAVQTWYQHASSCVIRSQVDSFEYRCEHPPDALRIHLRSKHSVLGCMWPRSSKDRLHNWLQNRLHAVWSPCSSLFKWITCLGFLNLPMFPADLCWSNLPDSLTNTEDYKSCCLMWNFVKCLQ